jgi:hypothetical protein
MQRPGVKGAPTPQQLFSGPAQFSPCPRLASRGDDQVMAQNRVANGLYDALRRAMPLPSSRIYFTTTGYVSSAALDYYFRRDTLHALNIGDTPFSDNLAIHQRAIDSSEFVIASEPGNGIAFGDFLKSERVQTQTLDMVRLNPDFKQIAAFTALNDRHYFLFQRTRPFFGYVKSSGLIDASASNPNGLPCAYWGISPSTTLTIAPEGPSSLRLVARARATVPDQIIRIVIDGKYRAVWKLRSGQFEDFTLPFTVLGGGTHQVKLIYISTNQQTPEAALFARLAIIPDDTK